MKYSQAILIGCVGSTVVASAFPTTSKSSKASNAQNEVRDINESDVISVRDMDDFQLDLRGPHPKGLHPQGVSSNHGQNGLSSHKAGSKHGEGEHLTSHKHVEGSGRGERTGGLKPADTPSRGEPGKNGVHNLKGATTASRDHRNARTPSGRTPSHQRGNGVNGGTSSRRAQNRGEGQSSRPNRASHASADRLRQNKAREFDDFDLAQRSPFRDMPFGSRGGSRGMMHQDHHSALHRDARLSGGNRGGRSSREGEHRHNMVRELEDNELVQRNPLRDMSSGYRGGSRGLMHQAQNHHSAPHRGEARLSEGNHGGRLSREGGHRHNMVRELEDNELVQRSPFRDMSSGSRGGSRGMMHQTHHSAPHREDTRLSGAHRGGLSSHKGEHRHNMVRELRGGRGFRGKNGLNRDPAGSGGMARHSQEHHSGQHREGAMRDQALASGRSRRGSSLGRHGTRDFDEDISTRDFGIETLDTREINDLD